MGHLKRWRRRQEFSTGGTLLVGSASALGLVKSGGLPVDAVVETRHKHQNDAVSVALGMRWGMALGLAKSFITWVLGFGPSLHRVCLIFCLEVELRVGLHLLCVVGGLDWGRAPPAGVSIASGVRYVCTYL